MDEIEVLARRADQKKELTAMGLVGGYGNIARISFFGARGSDDLLVRKMAAYIVLALQGVEDRRGPEGRCETCPDLECGWCMVMQTNVGSMGAPTMTEIKRYRARSSGEIAWDQDIPLESADACRDRALHGVPVMLEHPEGEYILFADHVTDKQAALAEKNQKTEQRIASMRNQAVNDVTVYQTRLCLRDRQIATLTAERDQWRRVAEKLMCVTCPALECGWCPVMSELKMIGRPQTPAEAYANRNEGKDIEEPV
jgi:hypothetical protein